jgi:hypothetical protein
MASAVNNDGARAASLIAVAVLPAAAGLTGTAYLHPAQFSPGFGRASLISAGLCLAGGVLRHRQPSRTDDFVWLWQLGAAVTADRGYVAHGR